MLNMPQEQKNRQYMHNSSFLVALVQDNHLDTLSYHELYNTLLLVENWGIFHYFINNYNPVF